ncbi:sugar transferase [Gloeocapsopsis dulcis]|uniref:Galactosyl-1-phosphate transferase n=1 Tax=Gloeocapsopsis dulcis AAB1 = 1H9 TaxID=1433147 RepID=A0A6N8FSI3_9CHRO|nr:sugar transferase [Gloeocapsopsis dulcis]MUL35147.1 galactosyl-1-phosphate transferase [Gloeocapsopsis dulcis AAB1 = 1H9]WNN89030.1 sugar transferase [Gloeocapsopsis dulcis]
MTAHSLLSGKRLRAFVQSGLQKRSPSDKSRTLFRPLFFSSAKKLFVTTSLDFVSREFVKRLFDVIFSLSVLILFSPVYLLLALIIAYSSEGPVFYIQERVGKNYKSFGCIKFRTMVTNADEMLLELMATSPHLRQEFADNFKLKQDPRITKIGRFLRLTSLDEFPQFWNVLKGDMSVVGPRPLVAQELHMYGSHIDKVLTIKPGITGLWQVSGRNDIPYNRRIQIDLYYVKFHNFWLDLWVIVKTIGVVIAPKNNGAY